MPAGTSSTAGCPTSATRRCARTSARLEAERARIAGSRSRHGCRGRASASATTCSPRSTSTLFWKNEAEWPRRNPAFYLGLLDPEIYLSKPYAPLESRMRAYIAYAK